MSFPILEFQKSNWLSEIDSSFPSNDLFFFCFCFIVCMFWFLCLFKNAYVEYVGYHLSPFLQAILFLLFVD